jgi:hypothetical protein
MKTPQSTPLLTLAICGVVLGFVAGCANQTPIQRVDTARRTYVATLQTITPLIQANVIPPEQHETLYQARVEAAKELDAAETAALNGDTLGFPFIMGRVNGALDKLLAAQMRAKQQTP